MNCVTSWDQAQERRAEAFKKFWSEIAEVKERAELVIVLARLRCGQEEKKIANPRGGNVRAPDIVPARDRHGSHQTAHRLKQLAQIGKERVLEIAAEFHARRFHLARGG